MPQSIARAQQLQGDRSLGEMQAVGRGWLKACNFGRGRAWSAYFLGGAMVSLAALATRNLTTVLALILIGSPVWGLRPMRALRSALTSLPMPGMVNSPFFLVSLTAISASSSRPAAACLLVISSFSAIVRTRTVLVIPFAIMCCSLVPNWCCICCCGCVIFCSRGVDAGLSEWRLVENSPVFMRARGNVPHFRSEEHTSELQSLRH